LIDTVYFSFRILDNFLSKAVPYLTFYIEKFINSSKFVNVRIVLKFIDIMIGLASDIYRVRAEMFSFYSVETTADENKMSYLASNFTHIY
jgi:hypothetical protein